VVTSDARNNNPWKDIAYYANSWVKYGSFTQPSFLRRGDGLCMAMGMVSSGTLGDVMALMPREMASGKQILMAAGAGSARARLDIADETIVPQQGTNGWFSMDSRVWTPGD